MFSKYEQDASLIFRLQDARMLDNAMQTYRKLVVERLYHIVPWLAGQYVFRRGREDVHKNRAAGRPQLASDDVHLNAVGELLVEHRCLDLY